MLTKKAGEENTPSPSPMLQYPLCWILYPSISLYSLQLVWLGSAMSKYLAEQVGFDAIKVFCASKMHEMIRYYIYTIMLY